MRVGKRVIAAAAAASLGAGIVLPVQAGAVIEQSRSFSVDVSTGIVEGFQSAEVNKGRVSWLNYNSPSYGTMPNAFYIDGYANGTKVEFAGDATAVRTRTEGDTDIVTLTHTDRNQGVQLVRTFRVNGKSVTVDVELNNVSGQAKDLALNLTNGMMSYDYDLAAKRSGAGYNVMVGGRYNLNAQFPGAASVGAGDSVNNAVAGKNNDARYQAGVWNATVANGGSLKGQMVLSGDANENLKDSDGDGFPDEWERNGFTAADGTQFPLNRWGADPNKKDLFLQLNWMKSEWETKNCSEKRQYAPTEEDFGRFLDCANANVNVYRPSRQTLNDLVDLFDKRGYNLHIDASEYYNNIPGLEPHGGPTVDYTPYYFNGEVPGTRLLRDRKELLGDRQSVFRVGIIGDTQERGNLSSGNGLLSNGAFYVADNYLMTSQEQLRNTILHEFGHNLGLTHSGAKTVNPPDSSYVPKYKSVMNYLYQFSHFDYSDSTSTNYDNTPIPQACTNGTSRCYNGSYAIKPDWSNLDLVNGEIGRTNGTTGVDEVDTPGHKYPTVRDLEIMAAEENNGKAGFRVDTDKQNIIIANRSDSKVNVQISNLGIDLHKFTLQVNYPGGQFRKEYPVESALSDYSKLPVEVPISNTAGYTGSSMPVQFRIYNEGGKLVSNETIDFSVLNYTTSDMDTLVKNLEKTDSPLLKDAQNTVGKKDPAAPTLSKPAPIATAGNTTVQPGNRNPGATEFDPVPPERTTPAPQPQPSAATTAKPLNQQQGQTAGGNGGNSASPGLILGIIIALLAVLGLGGVVAMGGGF